MSLVDLALTLLLLVGIALLVDRFQRLSTRTLDGTVTVHDGDTITLAGERIRIRGIDAPELRQSCTRDGHPYDCGRKALRALVQMVKGHTVVCEGHERDRYDRLLAQCMVGDQDIGLAMVEAGWAMAYGDYDAAEAQARRGRVGIWAGGFDAPRAWREAHEEEEVFPDGILTNIIRRIRRWFAG
ncbi:thermonuclease family protein [Nitratireductor sp. GISD-1A_MAKvit]|uniref:thermonuclease family protein n=1 Tax=Nitratireductor sp. GISD-1A_MAKvit TaxID=3234198 RepID=UPI0034656686